MPRERAKPSSSSALRMTRAASPGSAGMVATAGSRWPRCMSTVTMAVSLGWRVAISFSRFVIPERLRISTVWPMRASRMEKPEGGAPPAGWLSSGPSALLAHHALVLLLHLGLLRLGHAAEPGLELLFLGGVHVLQGLHVAAGHGAADIGLVVPLVAQAHGLDVLEGEVVEEELDHPPGLGRDHERDDEGADHGPHPEAGELEGGPLPVAHGGGAGLGRAALLGLGGLAVRPLLGLLMELLLVLLHHLRALRVVGALV